VTIDNDNTEIGGFAAILNARVAHEGRIARAKAFGWTCGGLAIACSLVATGVALALWGYGHMQSVRPIAEDVAKALVNSIERSELKTAVSGTMKLAANSEVKLAKGQTVRLEEGAIVKLDPQSTVRVVGELKVDVPQPSRQQLQLDSTNGDELPFTNYTLFRSVNFGQGEVVTGWAFDLSDTTRPKIQYCYYSQSLEKGLSAKYTIAINGTPQPPSKLSKVTFDYNVAVSNCIWFSGI
jgi:hypothetical protein